MKFKSISGISAIVVFFLCLTTGPVAASESVSGVFTSVRACDAYKSFKNGTNPGLVTTSPGAEYEAVEVNSKDMEWVRITVPDINDPLRWVARECGTLKLEQRADSHADGKSSKCNIKNQHDSYVLAMSWQPGFCEHFPYTGKKPECDALNNNSLAIDHLTLHGLWPNRKQCGTKYGDCGGPELDLDETTISRLSPWMPNFYFEYAFGNHEWKKHGTCQDRADDDYFLTALKLVELADSSIVGQHIKANIGTYLSTVEFFEKIKSLYGQDMAERIMLICTGGKYLLEVRIKLPLNFSADPGLGKMTGGAEKFNSRTEGCSDDKLYVERSGPD